VIEQWIQLGGGPSIGSVTVDESQIRADGVVSVLLGYGPLGSTARPKDHVVVQFAKMVQELSHHLHLSGLEPEDCFRCSRQLQPQRRSILLAP